MRIAKDIISLFIYLFVTPFYRTKNAVFVYHSVDNIDIDDDPRRMNVSPALFERHMEHLSRRKDRYTVTFDDGFQNVYMNAFPVLKKYGMKCIVFLTIEYMDTAEPMKKFFNDRYAVKSLTWDQVKEMRSCGAEIGSHALTHRNMARLDKEAFSVEAQASREAIKAIAGCDVTSFSYPFGNRGSFNKDTADILKTLGYTRAYTNIMGMDNSQKKPFAVRRIRVYGTDNMFRFRMKAAGAYNWVDLLNSMAPQI